MFGHSFDVYSEGLMLPDFVSLFWPLGDWNQQVLHFFVIDLHHRDVDLVVLVGVGVLGYSGKNLFAGNGDDTLSQI